MKIPIRITPCPIIQARIKILFDSEKGRKYPSAIVGNVLSNFLKSEMKKEFDDPVRLPINELPESIRISDKNLLNYPYYEFLNKDNGYVFRFGPKVLIMDFLLDENIKYPGWKEISNYTKRILDTIEDVLEDATVDYIESEYVDFFKDIDVLDGKLRLCLNYDNDEKSEIGKELQKSGKTKIEKSLYFEGVSSDIIISNDVSINLRNKIMMSGSQMLINSHVSPKIPYKDKRESLEQFIEKTHMIQKRTFFYLLSERFLKDLNPEY